ncbi:hypothetical protein M422DRAFT_80965, partial [Sphaerobolus stellatus SS14]
DEKIARLIQTIDEHCGFVQRARPVEEIASQKMILQKLMSQIIECAEFIRNYSRHKQFVIKALKALSSNVDQRIKDYEDAFTQFRNAFTQEGQLQSQIKIMNIEKDIEGLQLSVNLNDMPYASGARYNSEKVCLPGTRTAILQQIFDWVYDIKHQQRIFLLTGPAGSGKSAIAHSVAKTFDQQGRLGSSFCFHRQDAKRALQLFFPTLARDLADRDPGFKKSLGSRIDHNRALCKTESIVDQFEQLIASNSSNSSFIGQMLIVIDALDECDDSSKRRPFLELMVDPEKIRELPPYVRIFITARPDEDIIGFFNGCSHICNLPLIGVVSSKVIKNDIYTFVHRELLERSAVSLPGINDQHCHQIAEKAEGLFQWAAVVCKLLEGASSRAKTPLEELQSLLLSPSNDLGNIYRAALEQNIFLEDPEAKARFQLIVGFILAVYEPLSKTALKALCKAYGSDAENAAISIIPHLGALFNGILDDTPIVPIHTSVRDYLTNSKSGDFFVPLEISHISLTIATLKILNANLHFNMCKLSNSHIPNCSNPQLMTQVKVAIPLHLTYASQFVGSHFSKALNEDHKVALTSRKEEIFTLTRSFLKEKLLFWLETLGVLKLAESAYSFLSEIILKLQTIDPESAKIAREAIQFIRMAGPVIEYATPHIYLSTIPFIPSESILKSLFMQHSQQVAKVVEGLEKRWQEQTIMSKEPVSCVAFSPNGQRIVSASGNCIYIWNADVGKLVAGPFQGHTDPVMSVAFSHHDDGLWVVSGSDDKTIRIWDVETGNPITCPFQGHTDRVKSVAFSCDGQRVVSGSDDKTIRIWDTQTGIPIAGPFWGHTDQVRSVAFSPDGQRVVSGSWDKTVRIWDAHTGNPIAGPFQGHTDRVRSVAFSHDGQRIVSGSFDKTIRIWDAQTGNPIAGPFQGHTDRVRSVAFSPDGQRVVSGSFDKTIRIWDAQTGNSIAGPFWGHTDRVRSVAFSPDGQRVTGNPIAGPFHGHTDRVRSVAFSPDGQRVVSGSDDTTIRIWNVQTGNSIASSFQGHTDPIISVAFTPDRQKLLTGHTSSVLSVAFSPGGQRIVSGSYDNTIRIWDAQTGTLIGDPLTGHTYSVSSVAFSPDGQRIVSGSDDKAIRIWDAQTGTLIGDPLTGHTGSVYSVTFSPDGQRIVSGSYDQTIRIWDAQTGTLNGDPLTGHTSSVSSVAFSPDGQRIVSGLWDKTIQIWDAQTGTLIGDPLTGHT